MGDKEKIIETIESFSNNKEEIIEKVWTSALIHSSGVSLLYVLLPGEIEKRQREANERDEIMSIKGVEAVCELDGKKFRFFSNLHERRWKFSDNNIKEEMEDDDIKKIDSEANEYILTKLIDLLTRSEDVQLKEASLNYGGKEWDVLYEAEA